MSEQALSMDEPKQKLRELEKYMPNAVETVHAFGRFLVERLNSQLVPMGFVVGCHLAIHDLETGVDGFTGKPIRNGLVGYPPMIYALLGMEIPAIAKAIFPADFAAKIEAFVEEVQKKMDEEATKK